MGIGKTVLSKMDEFSEKFQATFDPPKIISVDNMMRWKDDNICPPFPIMTRIHDNSSHLKKFTLTDKYQLWLRRLKNDTAARGLNKHATVLDCFCPIQGTVKHFNKH